MFFGKMYVFLAYFVASPFGLFVRRITEIFFSFIFLAILGECFPPEAEIKMHPSIFLFLIFVR